MKFGTRAVGSEGLPLNISRETLLQNKICFVIEEHFANKCLDIFADIAKKKNYYITGKCIVLSSSLFLEHVHKKGFWRYFTRATL